VKDLLDRYVQMLIKFNKKLNLMSQSAILNVNENHLQDCIDLCKYMKLLDKIDICYDFGSGGGFPGIVYAIYFPETQLTLVEKDQRKAQFLKHVIFKLKLTNVTVWSELAEKIPVNVITGISRAFLPPSKSLPVWDEFCLRGSKIYMMKSQSWQNELMGVPADHWQFNEVHRYKLLNGELPRSIVLAEKL